MASDLKMEQQKMVIERSENASKSKYGLTLNKCISIL